VSSFADRACFNDDFKRLWEDSLRRCALEPCSSETEGSSDLEQEFFLRVDLSRIGSVDGFLGN